MRSLRPGIVAIVVSCLAVAGCGERSAEQGDNGAVDESAQSASPDPTGEPTEDLSLLPDDGAKRVRVTGTVTPGVEHGCHLLTAGGTVYQLLGGRPVDGTEVEVVGTIARDVLTTCQQGIPLKVERITVR